MHTEPRARVDNHTHLLPQTRERGQKPGRTGEISGDASDRRRAAWQRISIQTASEAASESQRICQAAPTHSRGRVWERMLKIIILISYFRRVFLLSRRADTFGGEDLKDVPERGANFFKTR